MCVHTCACVCVCVCVHACVCVCVCASSFFWPWNLSVQSNEHPHKFIFLHLSVGGKQRIRWSSCSQWQMQCSKVKASKPTSVYPGTSWVIKHAEYPTKTKKQKTLRRATKMRGYSIQSRGKCAFDSKNGPDASYLLWLLLQALNKAALANHQCCHFAIEGSHGSYWCTVVCRTRRLRIKRDWSHTRQILSTLTTTSQCVGVWVCVRVRERERQRERES